ncbi:hypothetical protein Q9233_012422 [Columba guinea]|nr:hypothetical protein Q9233_012422 [Columba guinea]
MVILDFVYSGILSLTGQNVIEVMSAASYLQMTDILNVCKTFIKSSLDINEKEKDHYLSLSAKSTNSEPAHPSLYRSRRKAKSNPRRSYSIPDEKANSVNENSWSSYSSYLSSEVMLQQTETQLSKRGRKQGSTRKRRKHLGLSQTHDFVGCKSNKAERASGDSSSPDPSHVSHVTEEGEFDAENDVERDDYGYNHESEAIHQAGKLICRKCKRHVTDLTGCVVQQGTRRYRLCHKCLAEANFDSIPDDLDTEHSPVSSTGNKRCKWALEEEQKSEEETMEEEPYNLVVRHVNDDIPEEADEKVKPNLR